MGGTKRTAMPVVVHGGLELQDALLGLFLGDQGVAAVVAAADCEPLTTAAFNKVSKELISDYWVVVMAEICSRAAPLLVVAKARLSK